MLEENNEWKILKSRGFKYYIALYTVYCARTLSKRTKMSDALQHVCTTRAKRRLVFLCLFMSGCVVPKCTSYLNFVSLVVIPFPFDPDWHPPLHSYSGEVNNCVILSHPTAYKTSHSTFKALIKYCMWKWSQKKFFF